MSTHCELRQIDPATLVIGQNIRACTREQVEADAAFIQSIRTQGVVSPVVAYTDENGAVVVLAGQRRTLAALITERETVPVLVYADKPEDADALRTQWDENERRAAMSEGDRAHGIEQFALLGLTAEQIATQTGEAPERVTAALSLNTSRREAMQEHMLTIEQAAALADFEDDEETTARLMEAAASGDFDHALSRARWDHATAEALAEATAELDAQGVTVTQEWPDYDADAPVSQLVDKSTGEDVDPEAHTQCPGHMVRLSTTRGEAGPEVKQTPYCSAYRKHGHRDRYASSGSTARSGPMTDEEKAERAEVIRLNKEWDAAVDVRREFLAQIATRKTAPSGAEALIAQWVTDPSAPRIESATVTSNLLGLPKIAKEAAATKTTKARQTVITLAHLLASWEANTDRHTWRTPSPWSQRIMKALARWGYTLSEVEQRVAQG